MLKSVLEAAAGGELHDALARPRGVSVGVSDLTRRAEVVLQVLPRSARRDVLDNHPVVGLGSGWVSPPAAVAAASSEATTATTVTVPVTPVPGVPGKLDSDAATLQVLSVHVLNRVVSIPGKNKKRLENKVASFHLEQSVCLLSP